MSSPTTVPSGPARRMRRRLALSGVLAALAVALGAGVAGATTEPVDLGGTTESTATVAKVVFGGGYSVLKRSW